jgi:hypothetical protein
MPLVSNVSEVADLKASTGHHGKRHDAKRVADKSPAMSWLFQVLCLLLNCYTTNPNHCPSPAIFDMPVSSLHTVTTC